MDIKQLLQLAVDQNASDLHIIVGIPPFLRVEGRLLVVPDENVVTHEIVAKFTKDILTTEQFERYSVNKEIDFSLAFNPKARFRVNAYTQKGSYAIAFRKIPLEIPKIDDLGLPQILHTFNFSSKLFLFL